MPNLQPQQAQKIHELIDASQILMAIQVYREATGVSLAEAKQAVEEMMQMEAEELPRGSATLITQFSKARSGRCLPKARRSKR